MKKCLLILLALFFTMAMQAQREKGGGIITQDQVRQITELVKPIKDQLERQIGADPRYLAYVDDVKRIQASTSKKERSSLSSKIKDKYSSFFRDAWSAARVDEAGYKNKIRRVFPSDLAGLIQFGDFLNFTINSSSSSKSQALDALPSGQCLDVCTMAAGEIINSSTLIGSPSGSWGNCYLSTYAMSIATGPVPVGSSETNGYLRNGISIPGTFPDDAHALNVKLSFQLSQGVMAFGLLGCSYAETRIQTFTNNELLVAFAPLIWYEEASKLKTISENYSLIKKNVSLSAFWSMSKTFTILNGSDMGWSDCNNIKWSICEQK